MSDEVENLEPRRVPEPPKRREPTHATYIPDRRPQWKYHTNIGQAKNACSYMRRESYLYEIVDGNLVELYHITPSGNGWKWGPDDMPWRNTAGEKKKARAQKIRELESKINWHKQQEEALFKELGDLVVSDED
jgi:hypothetical protein